MKPGLVEIRAAQERIANRVRRTPILLARSLRGLEPGWNLYLKLENLQVTGSFKARGAVNKFLSLEDGGTGGLVTASGGNHGVGVAYAGWISGRRATVYLPETAPANRVSRIAAWGAEVIKHGKSWDDANAAAIAHGERESLTYIHPFADPVVIAGQGTIGLEMLADMPVLDTIMVAIGGGGLISGVSLAVHALNPQVKIIGIEPTGAPTLHDSLQAGRVVELPGTSTRSGTLSPRQTSQLNFDIIRQHVEEVVLVTDAEMEVAQEWLWAELGIAGELAAAAAIAALLTGKVQPGPGQNVGVVICAAQADIRFE